MPEISVVIPSYNHAPYIGEAVVSVLAQTEGDLELIVVDDGSTDGSLDVLAGFSDPRLRVIRQANHGAHEAINRGLSVASGRYFAILNSDDAYHPERLEKAVARLKAEPGAGLLGSYIEIVDSAGRSLDIKHGYQDCFPWVLDDPERSFRAGTDLHAALLTENYWSTTSNFVFPRGLHERVGTFRPLRYTHDWDFALRSARLAPQILLHEPLVRYRVHAANTIRQDQVAMVFEICWILAVHLPQHIGEAVFDESSPQDSGVDRLLHSIYTFGVDRVLSVMLLQQLHKNPRQALKLLDPQDSTRAKYLDFIDTQLTASNENSGVDLSRPGRMTAKSNIKKILARLRSLSR